MKNKRKTTKKREMAQYFAFTALIHSYPGRLFLGICLIVFIGSCNVLLAGNDLTRFFLYSGIAIIASIMIGWVIYLVRQKG